jgi:hypothetical protein
LQRTERTTREDLTRNSRESAIIAASMATRDQIASPQRKTEPIHENVTTVTRRVTFQRTAQTRRRTKTRRATKESECLLE